MKCPDEESALIELGELVLGKNELAELMSAVISKGKLFRFRAGGWSMSPFIKDGDVLLLSPVPEDGPRFGDVVAALVCAKLIVHRIVACENGSYLLKGDNNHRIDGVINKSDVLAVVNVVDRDGRKIRIGMGKERRLIALLSRTNLLALVLLTLRRIRMRLMHE